MACGGAYIDVCGGVDAQHRPYGEGSKPVHGLKAGQNLFVRSAVQMGRVARTAEETLGRDLDGAGTTHVD